jgi:hypothetical protein
VTRILRLAFAALVVGAAVVFSGCIAIQTQTSSQRLHGFVTLRVDVCVADGNQSTYEDCDDEAPGVNVDEVGNGSDADGSTGRGQMLVGYRVPAGAVAPTSFVSNDGRLTLTRNTQYTAALAARYPPPAGFRWDGYLSSEVPFDPADSEADRTTSLRPEFTLPPGTNGAPFDGPFRWRAVVGWRSTVTGGAGDPVNCGDDSPAIQLCFETPSAARVPMQLQAQVSDIGVLKGIEGTAAPGETGTVTFPIQNRAEGTLQNRTVQLSATTTVPGATAKTAAPSLLVGANQTPNTPVTVDIPPGTPVGSYEVALTATAANGQPAMVRTNKATITVVDKTAPSIRVSSPGDMTYQVGQGVTADYGCTDETGGSGVASCVGPVGAGAAIDTSTPGTFSFTVTGTDNAGNTASATRTYTVVSPPPPPPPVVVQSFAPSRVNVTFAFAYPSAAKTTKFTTLQVKGVPAGSTVVATCKGGGCPKKKVKGKRRNVVFEKKNASGTVNITAFRNKALKPNAVITVTVTKPGAFGMVKKLTVKKNKKPVLTTTCLQPNSTTAKASCSG